MSLDVSSIQRGPTILVLGRFRVWAAPFGVGLRQDTAGNGTASVRQEGQRAPQDYLNNGTSQSPSVTHCGTAAQILQRQRVKITLSLPL